MRFSKMHIVMVLVFMVLLNHAMASDIHTAAKNGDITQVKSLIKANPAIINSIDNKGFTPLHIAITKNQIKIVEYLITAGANVNIKNKNGLSPLFTALDRGKNKIAILLIENGADIYIKGYQNRTLLHMAARGNNVTVARSLIGKGIEVNARDSRGNTALDLALVGGKADVTDLLINKGGKINVLKKPNAELMVTIDRIIHHGDSQLIPLMVAAGIDLGMQDSRGYTFLHKAAAYDRTEIADVLLQNHVEVNLKSKNGDTPVSLAAKHGHRSTVDFLISKGASKNDINESNYGKSPILEKSLSQSEAFIWYLDHSAWAVKSQSNLLIFDYTELRKNSKSQFLAAGYINPDEIKDMNVTVFVTHGHTDHFDPVIFNWRKSVKNIQYVLGFKPRKISANSYTYIGPNQNKIINNIKIETLKSNDAGVAFLIEMDGLTLYHAGDHANKGDQYNSAYHGEIDKLASGIEHIDMAFLLTGSACGGGAVACVIEGDYYAIEKFSPAIIFPMHGGGREELYFDFAAKAQGQNISNKILPANFAGDRFYYSKNLNQ